MGISTRIRETMRAKSFENTKLLEVFGTNDPDLITKSSGSAALMILRKMN